MTPFHSARAMRSPLPGDTAYLFSLGVFPDGDGGGTYLSAGGLRSKGRALPKLPRKCPLAGSPRRHGRRSRPPCRTAGRAVAVPVCAKTARICNGKPARPDEEPV